MVANTRSTVISLRLQPELARAFKVEAASRGLKLNALFEEMLLAYRETAAPGPAGAMRGDDDQRGTRNERR